MDTRIERSKVKSIKKYTPENEEYVYDIVMKDKKYPFFVANDILVHNSVYFSTGCDNVDDALTVSDALNKLVNKSYPKFMKNSFHVTDGRENYIIAEQEVVSDKGIFVAKKHYILHLVNMDGKELDKMKVMGLQIKKTNLPKYIRELLTKFFERFLKGEEWKSIKKDIVEAKRELKKKHVMDLGIPSGVNGIEKYTQQLNETKTAKGIPHMAKAAIFYNICLQKYKDGESPPVRSGEKVKKLYFYKQKNFGEYNAIAIPVDLAIIPEWWENLEPYIDADRQILSLIDKPIKNILDAIGEAVPNSKNVLADDLLEF
jgi:DNA polymerase elongation subunit (family B)